MKTKKMHRVLVSVLSLMFLFASLPIQSLAMSPDSEINLRAKELANEFCSVSNSSQNASDLQSQLNDDLLILKDKNFNLEEISIHNVDSDGKMVYVQETLPGLFTYINVWKDQGGSVFIHYVEGNIENTLEFTSDNQMFLDGHKVTIKFERTATSMNEIPITPFAGTYRYTQDSIPAGTTLSEYGTSGLLLSSTGMVDFGVMLGGIAVASIVTILTPGISMFWAVTNGAVSTVGYTALASKLQSLSPNSRYASFKEIRYARAKDNLIYHYKHTIWVYPERNYGGTPYEGKVFFEIVEPT